MTNEGVQLKLKLCRMESKKAFFLLRKTTEDFENKSTQVTKCLSALCLHNYCKIARPRDMESSSANKHFRKTDFFWYFSLVATLRQKFNFTVFEINLTRGQNRHRSRE